MRARFAVATIAVVTVASFVLPSAQAIVRRVPRRPDLVITRMNSDYYPTTIGVPCCGFSDILAVSNIGGAPANTSKVRMVLSLDKVADKADVRLTEQNFSNLSTPRLAPGATARLFFDVYTSAAPEGTYYVIACADALNAVAELRERNNCAVASHRITVDATPPVVEITSPVGGTTTGPFGSFTFGTGDASFITCTLDGEESPCALTFGPLATGEHTFTVYGEDDARNAAAAATTWTVDASPPLVTALSLTPGRGTVDAAFTLTDDSAITDVLCVMDGVESACDTPGEAHYSGLSPGVHTFEVFGVDEWLNSGRDSTPSSRLPTERATGDVTL